MQNLFSTFKKIETKQLIIAIVAAGIVLRLAGLTLSSFWYDESLPLEAGKLSFLSMLDATRFTYAPPLWGIIVWLNVHIFGANELSLRWPALVASILTFVIVYKICDEFGLTDKQKVISLLFVSLLPYQLWTAQDGRVYAITAGLYLCTAWFALRNRWVGLTICSILLLYAHYTSPFYLIAIYAAAAINNGLSWNHIKKVFASGLIAVVAFLPWVPIYIQTTKGDVPVPMLSALNLLLIIYNLMFANTLHNPTLIILALFAIATSILLSVLFGFRITWKGIQKSRLQPAGNRQTALGLDPQLIRYLQLTLISLVPVTIMIVWSIVWKNFIYYRLLVPMMIPLIIWMVYSLTRMSPAWLMKYAFLPVWMLLLVMGVVDWTPQAKSGDLRDVAELIKSQWQPGDVIYHITGTSYLPFSEYLGDKPEYLIDEKQHDWLLPDELKERFGVKSSSLEALSYKRAWIIYSQEPLVTEQVNKRAQAYIQKGTLVGAVNAWVFAPMKIYLVSAPSKP